MIKNIAELRRNPAKYRAKVQNIMWEAKMNALASIGIYEDMKLDCSALVATCEDGVVYLLRGDLLPISKLANEYLEGL